MKRFLFAMLALTLAVGCGGADKKEKKTEKSDEGKQVDVGIAYKVGDYYNENGKEGVVFEVSADGRHGKIVSLDQTSAPWDSRVDLTDNGEWINGTETGANSKSDGKANTDIIMSRSDSKYFEAFVWCRNKGNDWYLPVVVELKAIYDNKSKINSTLAKYGAQLKDDCYWSSSEDDEFRAWFVSMYDGDTYCNLKSFDLYVRAVSAF